MLLKGSFDRVLFYAFDRDAVDILLDSLTQYRRSMVDLRKRARTQERQDELDKLLIGIDVTVRILLRHGMDSDDLHYQDKRQGRLMVRFEESVSAALPY